MKIRLIVVWLFFFMVLCAGCKTLSTSLQDILPVQPYNMLPLLFCGILLFWLLEAGLSPVPLATTGHAAMQFGARSRVALNAIMRPYAWRLVVIGATLPFGLAIATRMGTFHWQAVAYAILAMVLLLLLCRLLSDLFGKGYFLFLSLVLGAPQLLFWFLGQITLARTGHPAAYPRWEFIWPIHFFSAASADTWWEFLVLIAVLVSVLTLRVIFACRILPSMQYRRSSDDNVNA